ncbi:hypothetical protein ACETK8_12520 [Brevundimonas staleyi]|uniref:Lipoprotein n=1 Tax=Brevundimonas staleyi TaxID=74326 RepID=A0ABW0FLH2_9CAUL
MRKLVLAMLIIGSFAGCAADPKVMPEPFQGVWAESSGTCLNEAGRLVVTSNSVAHPNAQGEVLEIAFEPPPPVWRLAADIRWAMSENKPQGSADNPTTMLLSPDLQALTFTSDFDARVYVRCQEPIE